MCARGRGGEQGRVGGLAGMRDKGRLCIQSSCCGLQAESRGGPARGLEQVGGTVGHGGNGGESEDPCSL